MIAPTEYQWFSSLEFHENMKRLRFLASVRKKFDIMVVECMCWYVLGNLTWKILKSVQLLPIRINFLKKILKIEKSYASKLINLFLLEGEVTGEKVLWSNRKNWKNIFFFFKFQIQGIIFFVRQVLGKGRKKPLFDLPKKIAFLEDKKSRTIP